MAGRRALRWPAWGAIILFVLGSLLLQSGSVSSAATSFSKWGRQVSDLSYERCKTLQSQYQKCVTATMSTPGRTKRDPGAPNSDRRVTYCKLDNLQYVKRCNYCKQDFTFCTPDQYRWSSSLEQLVSQVQQAGPLGGLHGQAATLAYTLPNRIAQFIGRATGRTPVITYYYIPPNNGIPGSCEQLPDNASPVELAEINGNGTSGKQCAFMRCEMGDNLAQLGNVRTWEDTMYFMRSCFRTFWLYRNQTLAPRFTVVVHRAGYWRPVGPRTEHQHKRRVLQRDHHDDTG